ncbi:MAG: hypothetical protein H0T85_01660 [Geodermatophilaceae bacterium]|nr:hypothetical protein [Geodermatophilaceae bacterium]
MARNFTETIENGLFVESLSLQRSLAVSTVVAFGDSITNGVGSDTDADNRYPDYLAERYLALPPAQRKGVANEGISGNRVTRTGAGQAAVTRLQRDALEQPGVETVILLEGINDLNTGVTADQVIRGYRDLIGQAHADGT